MPGVPVTVAAGFRDRDRAWLVQTLMPGEPLSVVMPALTEAQRHRLWAALGCMARDLHAVGGPWFGTPDGQHRYPDWPSMVRADAEGLLEDARRYGLDPRPFERTLEEIERHRDALREVRVPSVVHSDLDIRHVFVREGVDGWEITGVIDWEYARYADPHSESLLVEWWRAPPVIRTARRSSLGMVLTARFVPMRCSWHGNPSTAASRRAGRSPTPRA